MKTKSSKEKDLQISKKELSKQSDIKKFLNSNCEYSILEIQLNYNDFKDDVDKLMTFINSQSSIKELNFSCTLGDEGGAKIVSYLMDNRHINSLGISSTKIGNKTAAQLSNVLKHTPHLTNIKLHGNDHLDNKGLCDINGALRVNHHVLNIMADIYNSQAIIDNNLGPFNKYIKRNNEQYNIISKALQSGKDVKDNIKPWMLRYLEENPHDLDSRSESITNLLKNSIFAITGICKKLNIVDSQSDDGAPLLSDDLVNYLFTNFVNICDIAMHEEEKSPPIYEPIIYDPLPVYYINDYDVELFGDFSSSKHKCELM